MGALEPWHIIVILAIVLIVFGAGKMGDAGAAVGKSVRDFRSALKDDEPSAKTVDPQLRVVKSNDSTLPPKAS